MQQFLIELRRVVYGPGTWQEKRDAVLAAATEEDKTALFEFAMWFADGDDDDDDGDM